MSQKIFVNGPINVVRLSGKVGKIEKCIYVFFDYHADPNVQTKCKDVRSEDVAKYVVDSFDKSNKKDPKLIYDFFFERGPLRPYMDNEKYKGRYLDQMAELFIKSFNIDTEKKIVQKSSLVPNVRFHHTDIRNYVIDTFAIRNILMNHQLYTQYNFNNFKRVHSNIIDVANYIFERKKIIYENEENPKIDKIYFSAYKDIRSELPKKYLDDQAKKVTYKIRNVYENKKVKTIINKIVNAELNNLFVRFFSVAKQCLAKLEGLINEHTKFNDYFPNEILLQQEDGTYSYGFSIVQREPITFEIVTDINLLYEIISDIGVMIMDLYLLRRFLDKNYVTNALSYTGAFHSQNYILFLVKYFGFNITHYSYLKDDDIKMAQEKIKKANRLNDLSVLFWPPVFLQCSDMTNFPPLFT